MVGHSPNKAAMARFSKVFLDPTIIKSRTLRLGDLPKLIHGECTSFLDGKGTSEAWAYKPSGMNHNRGKKDTSQLFRLSRIAVTQKCHRKNMKRLGMQ